MGNCLSTCDCARRSEPACQSQEVCVQTTDNVQASSSLAAGAAPSQEQDGEEVRNLVQQELQALQSQISHSQAVLSKLHFRFNDSPVFDIKSDLAKVHRTTQTVDSDSLPKSLECVSANVEKGWQQITSSCPAIVNTAVQTDEDTTRSNETSGEYFLPPISPLEFQASEPTSTRDLEEVAKPFEPRPSGPDLDIYRSCRKLSVLPEEEAIMQEEETSPPSMGNRLAPTHYAHHQAHSFESYLLPVATSPGVQRQLSDPTPTPRIHPASRRTSRSTCRPLQLQPDSNYFRFPEVSCESPSGEKSASRSPPCVTFQDALEDIIEEDYFPRITSPTYNILQDTVSQLITMSSETLDAQEQIPDAPKKESLNIPGNDTYTPDGSTPYKTPPDISLLSTPGFFTPQETFGKLPDSSTSSAFHTPTSISPVTNPTTSNKSTSNSSSSFKTPPNVVQEVTPFQSSFNSPLHLPHLSSKQQEPSNENNEHNFTDVCDLKNIQKSTTLYVKPLVDSFDCNRSMLSILMDEPRVQIDNMVDESEESKMPFISFTSLEITKPPALVHSSPEVPSASLSSPDATLSPTSEGLARTPSRRRLQRSLVRISSETPLELVPVKPSVAILNAETSAQLPSEAQETQRNGLGGAAENMGFKSEDGPKMRRTNSDSGSSVVGSTGELSTSHSFPSLSDTVLKQLGALMEEVKHQKEENQSSEKDVENKFTSLMLAFKTDKLTLERRLELQLRLRDQAEQNMAEELNKLKAAVQMLSPLCTDSEKIELLEKVSEQVDALHKSTTRVSTSAEMHGAVQQENRLSKAVDIILRHVENLKQAYDKERTDHEETRKVLTDSKITPSAVLKLEGRGLSRARLGSLPRKLSNTILEAEQEENCTTKDIVSNGTGSSQPRESAETVTTCSHCQAPTRTLQRKPSRPTVMEERRASHTGETESEDENSPLEPLQDAEPPPSVDDSSNQNSARRVSLQVAWISKITEHFEWAQPVDQLVKHLRYCIAVILLIAALAVFTSTFILPHTRLSR